MDVSALLAQYLSVKSQINYDQLQQTKWSGLYKSMSSQLSEQTTAEGKWESSSDALMDADDTKAVSYRGSVYKAANQSPVEKSAIRYASACVPKYDPEKLDEYEQLDTQYETMQNMYETLLDELNAQGDSLKSAVGNAAKDTGDIGSS